MRRGRGDGVVARGGPRRRLPSAVAAACSLALAVLVAIGSGAVPLRVAPVGVAVAGPDACRPATLYAVGDPRSGPADTLAQVTQPLLATAGEKVSVLSIPAPPSGASYASAEQRAVTSLAASVSEHLGACPAGAVMLLGYSGGAHVAGDLASRIGAGQEPGIPADRVTAVGLFGDPARRPDTRTVPAGSTGQGVLPPRPAGFGALDAHTIEICAPTDPVCDSAPTTRPTPLEQAVASPVHASYPQLLVAANTPATRWASDSLSRLIASMPPAPCEAADPGASTVPSSGPATSELPSDPGGAAPSVVRSPSDGGSADPASADGGYGSPTGTDVGSAGTDVGSAGADGGYGVSAGTGAGQAGSVDGQAVPTSTSRGQPGAAGADGGYGVPAGTGAGQAGSIDGQAVPTSTSRGQPGAAGADGGYGVPTGTDAGEAGSVDGQAVPNSTSRGQPGAAGADGGYGVPAGTGGGQTASAGADGGCAGSTGADDAASPSTTTSYASPAALCRSGTSASLASSRCAPSSPSARTASTPPGR